MTPDHQSVALLLERLERHPPLEALITELDHSAAKALRGDILMDRAIHELHRHATAADPPGDGRSAADILPPAQA
jgi:hypothetical protein